MKSPLLAVALCAALFVPFAPAGAADPAAAATADTPAAATAPVKKKHTAQQEKMKRCSQQAKTDALKGDARKKFMSSCLKGSGG